MDIRTMVYGPAYLDRVLRVDRPLVEPVAGSGSPIDQSVDGSLGFTGGNNLELVDAADYTIEIAVPPGWPGPTGRSSLNRKSARGPQAGELSAD